MRGAACVEVAGWIQWSVDSGQFSASGNSETSPFVDAEEILNAKYAKGRKVR